MRTEKEIENEIIQVMFNFPSRPRVAFYKEELDELYSELYRLKFGVPDHKEEFLQWIKGDSSKVIDGLIKLTSEAFEREYSKRYWPKIMPDIEPRLDVDLDFESWRVQNTGKPYSEYALSKVAKSYGVPFEELQRDPYENTSIAQEKQDPETWWDKIWIKLFGQTF